MKYRKFRVRTYSTLTMIGGFILIIYLGHVPLMLLIFTIQVGPGIEAEAKTLTHTDGAPDISGMEAHREHGRLNPIAT